MKSKLCLLNLFSLLALSAVFLLLPAVTHAEVTPILLHEFAGAPDDGAYAFGSIIFSDGKFYGTTYLGGDGNIGTIFSINSDGTGFTLLHEFAGGNDDGAHPVASLIVSDGKLYGTTNEGGDANSGTIFSINTDGSSFVLLHEFAGTPDDGAGSDSQLTLFNSVLYGTTINGGDNDFGTIFSIKPDGSDYTIIHDFAGSPNDGAYSRGSLVVSDSTLYGITTNGGGNNKGTIFSINPDGTGFTLRHEFAGGNDDGQNPTGGSLTLSLGKLYGFTYLGGDDDLGTIFSINTDGTDFTLLHEFAVDSDGRYPQENSLSLLDSKLYGMTTSGGGNDFGTIFSINTDGTGFTLLHEFAGGSYDGKHPHSPLTLLGSTIYGITSEGGGSNMGIIFELPFIVPSTQTLSVVEGKDSTYDIGLLTEPTDNVTLTLSKTTPETGAGVSLSTDTLTFTPENWDTPQTVTVTGIGESGEAGDREVTISSIVESNDTNYDGIEVPDVTVTVHDLLQISTCLELQNVDLDGNYELTDDIDCSDTSTWNGGKGFIPIGMDNDGNFVDYFTGSLYGNDHTISDLTIVRPDYDYVGLCGKVDGAIFQDISITGSVEGGDEATGALVGWAQTVTVDNVSSYATVISNVSSPSDLGGLIGRINDVHSSVSNSHVSGDVVATTDSSLYAVGGLVGGISPNDTTITDSSFSGNITVTSGEDVGEVGGLVGSGLPVLIASSTVSGNITINSAYAPNYIGGLIGYDDNTDAIITDSSMTGDLTINNTGDDDEGYEFGGLVGEFYGTLIDSSTVTGNVTINMGVDYEDYGIAGLVGYIWNDDSWIIRDSSFTGSLVATTDLYFDNGIGGLLGLADSAGSIENSFSTGDVTVEAGDNVYEVGGLVGRGDSLYTLDISQSYATGNVSVTAGDIIDDGVGGLVGNYPGGGTIDQSYATGDITTHSTGDYVYYVGGLIGSSGNGLSTTTVTNSFASGNISATSDEEDIGYIGGFLGNSSPDTSIDSSYATGNLILNASTFIEYAGGFVGEASGIDTISNSFSTGILSLTQNEDDTDYNGGFIGSTDNHGTTFTNNFWYKTGSGQDNCIGVNDTDYNPSGCTAVENDSTYFLGNDNNEPMNSWDFDDIWQTVEGKYPILKNVASPYHRVTTNNATSITKTSAILNGTLNDIEGVDNATTRGFLWGEDTDYGNTTIEEGDFSASSFTATILNLTCDTTYHFKAYATNTEDTLYGNDKSFTTTECINTTPPNFDSFLPNVSLDNPVDLAFDSEGNSYVADAGNDRVVKFDSEGNFSATFGWGVKTGDSDNGFEKCTVEDNRVSPCQEGIAGSGAGQLDYPSGIAIDSSDNIWVSDDDNYRISIFNSDDLSFEKTIGWGVRNGGSEFQKCIVDCLQGLQGTGAGQFDLYGYPTGITFDALGYAYVSDADNNRIQLFEADGDFVTMFGWGVKTGVSQLEKCTANCLEGLSGGGAGELSYSTSLAFAPDGNLYIIDSGNDRISVFSVTSTLTHSIFGDTRTWNISFVKAFGWGVLTDGDVFETCTTETGCYAGHYGAGKGEFEYPYDVAFDTDGNLYVSDYNNDRIQVFHPDDTFYFTAGFSVADGLDRFEICTEDQAEDCQTGTANYMRQGEFYYPIGLAFDPDGNLYITDENSRIQKFSTDGSFGGLGGPDNWSRPNGVTHDTDGNIYVADSDNLNVSKFDANGNFLFTIGDADLCVPSGLTINYGTGVLYVADDCNNYVYMYNIDDGSLIDYFGVNGDHGDIFSYINDVALDPDDNVYVVDENNGIYKFDSSNNFVDLIGDDIVSEFENIAYGPDGNLYVTDWANNYSVYIFSTDGVLQDEWGTGGTGEGELENPQGIAFDSNGNLFINEESGCRVQAFTPDGEFLFAINGPNKDSNCNNGTGEFNEFSEPSFLDFDENDNLYVPDYGNSRIQKFTPITPGELPTLTTEVASDETTTGSTLHGTIDTTGDSNVTERGFVTSLSASFYNNKISQTDGPYSTDPFTASATDLSCSTTYHYRSYAKNESGTGYGNDQTFDTNECPPDTFAPTVTTQSAINISKTSVTLRGTITNTGGDNANDHGFYWGITTDYGSTIHTESSLGATTFTENLTGLTCHTTYHAQAFATNGVDTGTGSDISFLTDACSTTDNNHHSSGGGGGGAPAPVAPVLPSSAPTDCLPGYLFSPSTGRPCGNPPLLVEEGAGGGNPSLTLPLSGAGNSCSLGLTTLKQGSKGLEVKCLQTILHITADGSFGPKTKLAVINFQVAKGLKGDGVVGPLTKIQLLK